MQTTFRDLTCGDARPEHAGRATTLAGWVHRRRDLGQLIFLDLRDRYGITQVVIDAADVARTRTPSPATCATSSWSRCAAPSRLRREGTENPKLATGAVELRAPRSTILSAAKTPAFPINEPDQEADEAVRLKYRYLDLRRAPMQERMLTRSRLVSEIRRVHQAAGLRRGRDAHPAQVHAGGRPRLHRPVPPPAGQRLRPAPEPAAAQAAAHGQRPGPLLPDRALLARRGRTRRPPAGVHAARPRDELRPRGGRDGLRRGHGHRGQPRRRARTATSARSPSRASPTARRSTATAPTSPTSASAWS